MSEERKLCVDCKWIRYGALGVGEYCGRPEKLSVVTGEAVEFCSIERAHNFYRDGRCGPEAKFWEQKQKKVQQQEPFWKWFRKLFGL